MLTTLSTDHRTVYVCILRIHGPKHLQDDFRSLPRGAFQSRSAWLSSEATSWRSSLCTGRGSHIQSCHLPNARFSAKCSSCSFFDEAPS
ncbi:unnamed protein product [Peniophora sp. CBMAI 1063]|nr:unnamed protein product [Peniophora sp. CBMAI 1063]